MYKSVKIRNEEEQKCDLDELLPLVAKMKPSGPNGWESFEQG